MTQQTAPRTVSLPPPKVVARRAEPTHASAPTISISAFDKLREALCVLASSPRDLLSVMKDFVELVTGLPQVAAAAYFLRGSNDAHCLGPNSWSGFAHRDGRSALLAAAVQRLGLLHAGASAETNRVCSL